ncbi:MAG TPA: hypothetical protein VGR27_01900, partial [Longimicrobiaceae bacterium]|nr:hypothetical protein [Longimicrobiaceae bacterium]
MQQWREVKARHPDALIFFRVGDFYEMFNEDAEEGARLLDLTLTSRNNGSSRAPLAGVPVHALDTYLERLVALGRRVAICEQVEDPALAKGIVRREVTQTVTPGAVFSDNLLDSRRNNFLVAFAGDPAGEAPLGMALADLSTGELVLQSVAWEELRDLLARTDPSELLLPRSWEIFSLPVNDAAITYRGDWLFNVENAAELLRRHYGVLNLEGFGLGGAGAALIAACGALVAYLGEVQPTGQGHLRAPRLERGGACMQLDEMTCRNLELVEPLRGDAAGSTLLGVLDEALTPMGGRLLRRWLLAPLLEPVAIERRLAAVAELVEDAERRRTVRA